jgi:alcohol dehydrogenase
MQAIQLEQPGRLRRLDLPEPPPPAPGEALVRVHRVGICGTDISGYLGTMPFFSYPRIPGHELGVEVLAIGQGVTHVRPGDRCSVEPYLNCQNCSSCRRGHANCCEHHQTLGVHCDGGLRPRFLVPARKLHRSRTLAFEQLALVETLAVGCHAINRAHPQPQEHLLVIGAGPIGLAVVAFARLAGVPTIVMDLNAQRLEFCKVSLGVSQTVLTTADGTELEALRRASPDGSLPTIVVDATGSHKSMSHALHYADFAGRVVYVGITQQDLTFPHAPLLHRRELTLLASRNALAQDFSHIIQLIEDGRLDTQPWITHRSSFAALPDTFPAYTKPETGVVKAIIELPPD